MPHAIWQSDVEILYWYLEFLDHSAIFSDLTIRFQVKNMHGTHLLELINVFLCKMRSLLDVIPRQTQTTTWGSDNRRAQLRGISISLVFSIPTTTAFRPIFMQLANFQSLIRLGKRILLALVSATPFPSTTSCLAGNTGPFMRRAVPECIVRCSVVIVYRSSLKQGRPGSDGALQYVRIG